MLLKITFGVLLAAFITTGCTLKTYTKEYRTEKAQLEHPDWDAATVEKVAARKVEAEQYCVYQ